MFATFPELLFLAPASALLLRLALAALLAYASWRHFVRRSNALIAFAVFEGALAAALAMGAWTQPAALIAAAAIAFWMTGKEVRPLPLSTLFLALAIALSLVVTGPGPFAFDMPL